VRDLGTTKHWSFKYAISNFYILNWKNKKDIIAYIQREVHFVDNLKINIFIGNYIIKSKDIVIDIKKREVYINNCNIIINVEIKFSKLVVRLIYLQKIIVIFLRTEISIVVYYFNISKNRDFLFKSKNNTSLVFYANIIDVSTKTIIARNNNNKSI